ncbi:hypothetical protein [Brevundimonas sp.]
MTNKVRGEVEVVAKDGPKAGTFTLLLDFNALCDLEDHFPGIMDGNLDIKGVKPIRQIFHAGFATYHPDLSERDVGAIIHSIGMVDATQKLAEAMKASFPEAKELADPQ